ncbi:jg27725, partial [Pararge aegeria aegeria]
MAYLIAYLMVSGKPSPINGATQHRTCEEPALQPAAMFQSTCATSIDNEKCGQGLVEF